MAKAGNIKTSKKRIVPTKVMYKLLQVDIMLMALPPYKGGHLIDCGAMNGPLKIERLRQQLVATEKFV